MNVDYIQGNITEMDPSYVIVNAANPSLLGGGGVDGAIHKAAGWQLKEHCKALPQSRPGVRCMIGQAVYTPAFDLPHKGIIHTVGPIFPGGRALLFPGEKLSTTPLLDLQTCLISCLDLAHSMGFKKIAFPAISCGVYGCSVSKFATVLGEVLDFEDEDMPWGFENITIVLFTDAEYQEFEKTWKKLTPQP